MWFLGQYWRHVSPRLCPESTNVLFICTRSKTWTVVSREAVARVLRGPIQ
eukprot:CAMPEP_0177569452 /NCGR_PEP_ID=MMETSP0369-20130122/76299_1 /TAXON_ID=447022 ORGANISM="Scrippsiella hangoei-like, Strain SHHI-4" /NCGR_SAMPLE_ID=MMETSP0369 /ASSEMBLY_ACC=CAM_ASM_000364 /LENGTH=49 /DNA_ID= /DNA_START= /DNA_END= /DNA_ORIENTATION=